MTNSTNFTSNKKGLYQIEIKSKQNFELKYKINQDFFGVSCRIKCLYEFVQN